MERVSVEVRDSNNLVQRGGRNRFGNRKFKETSWNNLSRIIKVSTRQGGFNTKANMDESGEFDRSMNEWTVYFLEKDQPSSCSNADLLGLEIQVGERFGVNFKRDMRNIHARVYNIESDGGGEKSIIFFIGNQLTLLGRVTGCPEERSPNSDADTVYSGSLLGLLRMLRSEEMAGSQISFGCVIFKDFLLNDSTITGGEEKSNWESFR